MDFFIEVNQGKKNAVDFAEELCEFIESHGSGIVGDVAKSDVVLVVGGDGTFIETVDKYWNYDKPFLGINCGHLGYLAELNPNNYKEKLEKLFKGECVVHERLGLFSQIRNISGYSCNDVYIKNNSMNIMDFDVYINGMLLSSFKADGIIISSPTGSTGYSMSCNGSFVDPDSNVILISLIAPHTLMNRSIVLNENVEVKVKVTEARGKVDMALDGKIIEDLDNGDEVIIRKAEKSMKIIEIDEKSFISRISEKLMR